MSTSPPALLLLGGFAVAWNQRFLHAARRRGLAVLVVDSPGVHVDRLLASWRQSGEPGPDEAYLAGPGELAAIVDRAAHWRQRYAVRGVCSLREEYVGPAAVVADLFDLPSPGLRTARVCRNKYLQRRYLADYGPAATLVHPDGREAAVAGWRRYPLVVKPVGRLASSGVRLVAHAAALRGCLSGYGPDETLLFEERVSGPEYSVESLSHHGKVRYAGVTQKRTTEHDSEFFVEMGHTTPAPQMTAGEQDRLLDVHRSILDALAFDTGMAHAEYRIALDGRPVLIEIAARPPGDSIMALHWLATGTPLEDAVVGLAVGEDVTHPAPRRLARQVYLSHRPGVLAGVDVAPDLGVPADWFDPGRLHAQVSRCGAPGDPPALRCVVALKPRGTALGPIRESGDRAAMLVLDAATTSDLDDLEARCRRSVSVRVDS